MEYSSSSGYVSFSARQCWSKMNTANKQVQHCRSFYILQHFSNRSSWTFWQLAASGQGLSMNRTSKAISRVSRNHSNLSMRAQKNPSTQTPTAGKNCLWENVCQRLLFQDVSRRSRCELHHLEMSGTISPLFLNSFLRSRVCIFPTNFFTTFADKVMIPIILRYT